RKVQEAETAARKQQMFEERIKRFLDLKIKDEDIEIVPLRSIDEFKAEGELMHHCVFASKYFERLDCLILSAKIGEEHIETIEVDLLKWQVVQSRGKFNQPTPYHDKIVNLVKSNINLIKRIA
ncbi:MAG: PcfJ domain-containing protein, partial [Bacteroidales bacterium]